MEQAGFSEHNNPILKKRTTCSGLLGEAAAFVILVSFVIPTI